MLGCKNGFAAYAGNAERAVQRAEGFIPARGASTMMDLGPPSNHAASSISYRNNSSEDGGRGMAVRLLNRWAVRISKRRGQEEFDFPGWVHDAQEVRARGLVWTSDLEAAKLFREQHNALQCKRMLEDFGDLELERVMVEELEDGTLVGVRRYEEGNR